MRYFALTTIGIALIASLLWLAGPATVAQEGAAEGAKSFEGKILVIVRRNDQSESIHLEKAKVSKLEGRSFLVGTGADTPENWQKGKIIWVALDDIGVITVFGTVEELRKATELAPAL